MISSSAQYSTSAGKTGFGLKRKGSWGKTTTAPRPFRLYPLWATACHVSMCAESVAKQVAGVVN